MTLSELIKKLEEIKEKYGELLVYYYTYDIDEYQKQQLSEIGDILFKTGNEIIFY